MIKQNKNAIEYYQFSNFSQHEDIVHAVFSRKGGFGKFPYDTLNLGYNVGDEPEKVTRNMEAITGALGIDKRNDKLLTLKQVHGNKVVVCSDKDYWNYETAPEADALVTDSKGVYIMITVADCQAVLIYDPICKVVANVHAGWRGSVCNVIGATIETMIKYFRCDPRNMIAAIGPSLGACCAEFINYRTELPESLWKYQIKPNFFDFWQISYDQLNFMGVPANKIEMSRYCSKCQSDNFFSYRRDKITGRFGVIIGIKT